MPAFLLLQEEFFAIKGRTKIIALECTVEFIFNVKILLRFNYRYGMNLYGTSNNM